MAVNFRSMAQMNGYFNKKKQDDATKGNAVSINNLVSILEYEGKILYKYIIDEIHAYYNSYDPVFYIRTYNFISALRITPVIYNNNKLSLKVYFDEQMGTHPSIWLKGEPGYVPILINYGWEWKHESVSKILNGKHIYRFSYYEGFHYIEKAISKYNMTNKYGFKIHFEANFKGEVVGKGTL